MFPVKNAKWQRSHVEIVINRKSNLFFIALFTVKDYKVSFSV